MSTQQLIESHREGAEVYHGAEVCKQRSVELLKDLRLPNGLLPLEGIEEVGYNRAAGFVWLRQIKATTHSFKAIGRTVSYATEVTAFVEDRRMKRMTGVKSRELLIWITLVEMYIDDPEGRKITFKTPAGLSRAYPVSAFEVPEEPPSSEKEIEKKEAEEKKEPVANPN